MNLVCLDLEGVLIPEIWINFAKATGINELKKTTRDEPDYDLLMKERINILSENNFTLKDIQEVINKMDPLEGAADFLDTIRSFTQVIILSDTFEEFAAPLMKKLKYPTLFCNSLIVDKDGIITDFKLRIKDGKKMAVEGFKKTGCRVLSAGDSYNDLSMIKVSDKGALFRAPDSISKEYPQYDNITEYSDFINLIKKFHKS